MEDKVSTKKYRKKKGRSVVETEVGGKNTAKVADANEHENILIEQRKSGNEVTRDVDRKKSPGDRLNEKNAATNTKEESDLGFAGDDVKGENTIKGDNGGKVRGRDVAKETKGKKSMSKSSKVMGNVMVRKGENSGEGDVPEVENVETGRTLPRRHKRGADAEIALTFLLSSEKGTSRLRPRKDIPSFRKVVLSENDYDRIVGKRVKIFWSGSRKWFVGRIKSFDTEKKLHKIFYDDGDKEELDLKKEKFELEVLPSEAFPIYSKMELNPEKKEIGLDGGRITEVTTKRGPKVDDAKPVKHAQKKQKTVSKPEKWHLELQSGEGTEADKVENLITDMEVDSLTKKVEENEIPGEINNLEKDVGISSCEDNDGAKLPKRLVNMKKKMASKSAKSKGSKAKGRKATGKEVGKLETNMTIPEEEDEKSVRGEINAENPGENDSQKNHNEAVSTSEVPSEIVSETSDEAKPSNPRISPEEKGSNGDEVSGDIVREDLLKVGDTEPLKKQANTKKKLGAKAAKRGGLGRKNTDNKKLIDLVDMDPNVLPEKAEDKAVSGKINVEGEGTEVVNFGKGCHDLSQRASQKASKISDELPSAKGEMLAVGKNPEIMKQKIENGEVRDKEESKEKNTLAELELNAQATHLPEIVVRKGRAKIKKKK
ncbi:PREDICTED: uncharacterized protein LOC104585916 isoform X2 [Nelumbo nucifera]|uniref:Uncharacterized protein LOC104585916 isoform X2 n=1 Tax=Nelumbo nucifera TaxID=4432 RepID=A0A1U7Z248_NELNU|nr:PREDICTED: uncharacterized protein LOC104585916 isoform X2 [Nelumbo nucifera]XP_019056142.1 PREDICTED: uncharacterized protein LOC104585916 isoform X2 [Nelumbo nucifera]